MSRKMRATLADLMSKADDGAKRETGAQRYARSDREVGTVRYGMVLDGMVGEVR